MRKSLEEVHESVDTEGKKVGVRRLMAFLGPAYLISVGYMDPGNWATDIAAGSRYGYELIWVLLMSNLMAILLQGLSSRLGIVRGLDLAQVSKERYNPFVNFILYIFAEIAIAACDLAEVLGMAIGINLLTDLPMIYAVLLTFSDTFLLLFLINHGMRKMEAFIIALIAIIGVAFIVELFFAQPDIIAIGKGMFIPNLPDDQALYIAIAIIGATVMPHNLYLHSSLVQTRKFERSKEKIKAAIRYNRIDSIIALNLAFFVNAAILILSAAAFYENGLFDIAEIQDAYKMLDPLLNSNWAAILFAVALIAAGQSSTITGTLAGQIVMEGYLNIRIQPWVRRIITRSVAIIPAVIVLLIFGTQATGSLLILSQVILSLQLGFAIIPLIYSVSDKEKMGIHTIKPITKILAWLCTVVIVSLNIKWVIDEIVDLMKNPAYSTLVVFVLIPIVILTGLLLLYILLEPYISKKTAKIRHHTPHNRLNINEIDSLSLENKEHKRIAVTLDFTDVDKAIISYILTLDKATTELLIIHIVESAGALLMGNKIEDFETSSDKKMLDKYAAFLTEKGFKVKTKLDFGNPKSAIPLIVNDFDGDLLVMGAHGHTFFKDLFFGTTINRVRHKIHCPLLIIKNKKPQKR